LLQSWSALHFNSNAICDFKIGSFFSILELSKVAEQIETFINEQIETFINEQIETFINEL